jgi:hypothetical protein
MHTGAAAACAHHAAATDSLVCAAATAKARATVAILATFSTSSASLSLELWVEVASWAHLLVTETAAWALSCAYHSV